VEDNPYSTLARMMSVSGAQLLMYPGTVRSLSPLSIYVEGVELSGPELMVNAALLQHEGAVTLSGLSGSLSGMPAVAVTDGTLSGTAALTPALAVGDIVLLLTTDVQMFYVLCKVVSV
jgi:hypothetical protein